MSTTLRESTLHDLAAVRARHTQVFAPDWGHRAWVVGAIVLALALAGYGFWRLEFSFARLGSGFWQIVHIVGLMFPPSPGGRLPLYLHALGETLAIALLGTLTAAYWHFPWASWQPRT
jgi:phosphonate transport system permease protein